MDCKVNILRRTQKDEVLYSVSLPNHLCKKWYDQSIHQPYNYLTLLNEELIKWQISVNSPGTRIMTDYQCNYCGLLKK